MFEHQNIAKSIYACPHPSIPTIARPHIASGLRICESNPRVKINYLAGQSDPTHMKPASRVNRKVAGRVGSGQGVFKSRGSGRVKCSSNFTGRVWSGQQFFKSRGSGRVSGCSKCRGSGRVGSRGFQISRVGSGRVKIFQISRVGSG